MSEVKRISIVFLILTFGSLHAISKQTQIDSLQNLLTVHTKPDTTRAKLLTSLSFRFRHIAPDKGLAYGRESLSIAKTIGDSAYQALALKNIGYNHYYLNDYDSAIEYYSRSLVINEALANKNQIASLLNAMGIVLNTQGNIPEALAYHKKALAINEELENKLGIASNRINMGNLYFSEANFASALEYYLIALAIYEEMGDARRTANVLNNISTVYLNQKNYPLALEGYNKALAINQKSDNKHRVTSNLFNIGLAHKFQNEYDSALEYFTKAHTLASELENRSLMASTKDEIGMTYLLLDQYQLALANAKEGLKIRKELGETSMVLASNYTIAYIYHKMERPHLALKYAKMALSISEETNNLSNVKDASEIMYKSSKSIRDHEAALKYLEKYMTAKDSLFSISKTKEIAKLSAVHELKQKEAENTLLQKEREVIQSNIKVRDALINKQQLWIAIVLSILILLVLFAAFMYRSWQAKKRMSNSIKELNQSQSRWFTNIAHEFRTPLTLVTGPLSNILSREGHQLNTKTLEEIKLIKRNGDHLTKLVNEILDISKLEAGVSSITVSETDMSLLVHNILTTFQLQTLEKDINIETNVPESLFLGIDREKITTVINNLISNALKFTDPGGKITINLTKNESIEKVVLTVGDTGVGIAPEHQPLVFDRYFQAVNSISEKTNMSQGGSGLGLALSYEIVNLLDGEISVESKLGEGSEFTVSLPMNTVAETMSSESPLSSASDDIISMERETVTLTEITTVLLVEDHTEMRKYIKDLLTDRYQVIEARDGIEAFEYLTDKSSKSVDLVLSDIMMPGMNGLELVKKIKSELPEKILPIILITARAGEQDKLRGLRVGVDDYVVKPFQAEELLARIENIVVNTISRKNAAIEIAADSGLDEISSSYTEKLLLRLENEVIDQVSNSQLSVEYLADFASMHSRTLSRYLKKTTGLTPGKFIRDIRLQLALQFLETKKYNTVHEIANAVGFESPAHFTQAFIKRYGKRPSEYLS
ncbi:tetratricopeptide repeat protein [Ekhidna sp.]